jgi:hypothetical protein
MPENNPFRSKKSEPSKSGGILDIDKIIEQEKIHAHRGVVAEPAVPVEPVKLPEPTLVETSPEVEELPEVQTVPASEEFADDEPSQAEVDERYDDEPESEPEPKPEPEPEPGSEPTEAVSTWHPPTRRIPRVERPTLDAVNDEPEMIEDTPEATEDIIINPPKNTPNRRNLMLIIGAGIVIIGLIFLIPKLIEGGILFKSSDTPSTVTPSGENTGVTAGLSKDVKMKKVRDGLESSDPDTWEATFTVDTTDITLEVDCTSKPGGGTSPNLSCVGGSSGVTDGTFVKPFTAGEGWTYDGADYGYCFSFADKVSSRTVQSDLYGSSGIQLFYMADDFKICSKKAGNPDNTPKGSKCDSQTYCPAVRLRSIS